MVSAATLFDRRRIAPFVKATGMATSAFGHVGPPPTFDLSGGSVPATTREIQNAVTDHRALGQQITALTGEAPKAQKQTSVLGDALAVLNPFDIKATGVTACATMAGMGPMAAVALGMTASLMTRGMHPLRSAERAFTPQRPTQPATQSKASPGSYASWADQVAPISSVLAAPTMMLGQGGPRKPAPKPDVVQLTQQFQAYDKALRGLGNLDRKAGLDATKPGMVADTTWSKMDPSHADQLYQTKRTDLSGIGIGQAAIKSLHAAPAPSFG